MTTHTQAVELLRKALDAMLTQFTSTPSTLKDSDARCQAHDALMRTKSIEAPTSEPAPGASIYTMQRYDAIHGISSRVGMVAEGAYLLRSDVLAHINAWHASQSASVEDAKPERRFPMQRGPSIPWSMAEAIYAGYAALYGKQQSLERLAERGGFSWKEVEVIYGDRNPSARRAIDAAIAAMTKESK